MTQSSLRSLPSSLRSVALLALMGLALMGCDMFVSPDARVERADKLLAEGNYSAAMAELKTALQKDPAHGRARLGLARLSLWLGDLASAEKEIERALASGADAAAARSLQYQLFLDQGKFDELETALKEDTTIAPERRAVLETRVAIGRGDRVAARAAVQRALAAAPDDGEALLESARLDVADGKSEPALELPTKVAKARDVHARALFLRAAVLMNRGSFAEAKQALTEAAKIGRQLPVTDQLVIAAASVEADLARSDVTAAEQSLKRLTAWAPQALVTHYLSARVAILKNDFVNAVAEGQRALRIDGQHVPSQLLLASAHLAQGSLEQAHDVLTRLLASKPDTPAARKLLAQVYLARNQPEEAQRILAAAGTSSDADSDWLMGTAMLRAGDVQSGIEHLERASQAAPEDAARRIELASAYIAARMPQKAIAVLADVPATSPQVGRARALMVLASAAGKPRDEARREVQELAGKHQKDGHLLTVAGGFLAGAGDLPGGKKLLEQAIELDPKSLEARLSLARIAAAERKAPEAQARLNEILAIDPKSQTARIAMSEIAWALSDRAGAVKWLEDAIAADPAAVDARLRLAQLTFVQGDGARARGLLDQVIQVSSDRRSALTATANVLARAGMTDDALTRFKEASSLGDSRATIAVARTYFDSGDLANARQWAQKASAGPSTREAEQLLIAMDAREGNVDRALQRAAKLSGDASPATNSVIKGDLQTLAGKPEAAIASYEDAQRRQPTAQNAVRIFNAKRKAGMPEPERSLREWLQRTPGDADVRRMLAAFYEQTGDQARAIAEYETLIKAPQVDPFSLNNLAWLLHGRGEERALALAKQAHEAAPQYAEIADTYGWILVRMDRVAEGLDVLKVALTKAPGNPDIQYHLAYAYAKTGERAQAAEMLKKALGSNSFASRADAEQLLRSVSGSGV